MTRKQAVTKALELLSSTERTQEGFEISQKLTEIMDEMPFTRWSAETIHDTLTQFAAENGRNPTTTDIKRKGMPSHTVIKLRFGMTARDFLNTYYPPKPKAFSSALYGDKSKIAWTKDFVKQYNTIKPKSSKEYNLSTDRTAPSWQTIAKYNGVKNWRELLTLLKLPLHTSERKNSKFSITHTITVGGRIVTDKEWFNA